MSQFYLYIAGASAELERAQHWIAACRKIGIHITYDWTKDVQQQGPSAAALSKYDRRRAAYLDRRAINKADCVWLLAPPFDVNSTGCWWELSWAQAMAADYGPIVSGPGASKCIFTEFAERLFDDDESAFYEVKRYADSFIDRGIQVACGMRGTAP